MEEIENLTLQIKGSQINNQQLESYIENWDQVKADATEKQKQANRKIKDQNMKISDLTFEIQELGAKV